MDQYLKKIKEKNNLMDKIVKIQKVLIKIQIILLFILLYLLIFKIIFVLKLICLIPMFTISIISSILAFKAKKLRNDILELSRELEFMENKILEKIQDEGLAILKLNERLEQANIEHTFIDRRYERMKRADHASIDFVNEVVPFDFQIFIEENGNRISLIQSPFSYGINQNLIEVYNFQNEPVVLEHEMAAVLIVKKMLNSYIIAVNDKTVEDIKEIFRSLNNQEGSKDR